MNYLLPLLFITFVFILPSHWRRLKLKRDKILTVIFILLFAIILLLSFIHPKVIRSAWEGRFIIIGLVVLLFMIPVAVAEFISLRKPNITSKAIIFIAVGIPIIILILAASFIAWHYYTEYLPHLRE